VLGLRGWRDQLPQCLEDFVQLLVMLAERGFGVSLELFKSPLDLGVRGCDASQLNERPHDRDVDGDRGLAPENAGQHRHALLCEDVGRVATSATPLL
jgi:hypothetical protein